eukprot:s3677_g6.t1
MIEQVGRVVEGERISDDPLWKGHIKSWGAELAADAPPKKPAEMYTVAIVLALELTVMDDTAPVFQRALAWVLLCMVWGAMRCDDVQAVLPYRSILSNYGLRLVLGKSKTTGPDKIQKEVSVHIFRTISLSGEDWLKVGYDIWETDEFKFRRDYLVMEPSADWVKVKRKFLPPSGLASHIGKLLGQLAVPKRTNFGWELTPHALLLPDGLESFYSGHSCFPHSDEGKDEAYFEDEAIQRLCDAAENSGANPNRIRKRHSLMSMWTGRHCLGGVYPTLEILEDDWQEPEDADESAASLLGAVAAISEKGASSKPQESKYFITISRRTCLRRLHLSGCFVKPDRCCEVLFTDSVSSDEFDTICQACKKKMLAECGRDDADLSGSSTASSSSTASEAEDVGDLGNVPMD